MHFLFNLQVESHISFQSYVNINKTFKSLYNKTPKFQMYKVRDRD